MRAVLINTVTYVVENIIEVEPGAAYTPPPGQFMLFSDVGDIGDTYNPDGGIFTPPPPSPPPPPPPPLYPTEVIIASPGGTPFKVSVADDGTLTTEPVGA